MALTKAQISQVTVAALGAAPGGYEAQLAAFNTQDELAAFLANEGLLGAGKTNAEYALEVKANAGGTAGQDYVTALFNALEAGTSRAEAVVDFVGKLLVTANPEFDAKIDTAKAYTGGSTDVNQLKAAVQPAPVEDTSLTVTFTDNEDDQTSTNPNNNEQDVYNVGKAQLDAGQSKISADYTFVLENQIGEDDQFNGMFLSPIIERQAAESSGSQLFLELLDLRAEADGKDPLERVPVDTFAFTLDGSQILVQSDAIFAAKTYAELFAAIEARITELGNGVNVPAFNSDGVTPADAAAYAKLSGFTVELGNQFTVTNQAGVDVSGTQIVLTDAGGATLTPQGFVNKAGVIPDPGYTLYAQLDNVPPTTVTKLITTNLDVDNVGYGSQGAGVNLAGQSASDKGVEEIKVTANNGVWLTTLTSKAATHHLERIELQTGSDSYFRVGTQKNDPNHVVALVDEDFGDAGLIDVQQVAAGAAESVAINSYITDAVLNRYELEDTGIYTADDSQAEIDYALTSGNDVLQLRIDTEVVAYADTDVSITTGGGNDFVHLQLNQGHTYGDSWLTNQQENDNISISSTSGNNTIWTEGAGDVTITTGAGADTIYADNSGRQMIDETTDLNTLRKLFDLGVGVQNDVHTAANGLMQGDMYLNGLFVMNAASANIGDILTEQDNALSNGVTPVAQVFNTFKNTLQVSFLGFESSFVEVAYDKTNYTTSTQQINQAIKKAINTDATLSKLLVVKEFAGNVLVVESLIDGTRQTTDLGLTFLVPDDVATATPTTGALELTAADLTNAAVAWNGTGAAALADNTALTDLATLVGATGTEQYSTGEFATAGATAVTGTESTAESDNVINVQAGNDVVVLGTGADSNDTLVLTGNFGHNVVVNFDATAIAAPAAVNDGGDLLDFTSYLVDGSTNAAPEAISLVGGAAAGAALVDAADDEVQIVQFAALGDAITGLANNIDIANGATLADLTAAKIQAAFTAVTLNTTDTGEATEHVFLIHNEAANAGEYLVVTASSTAASDAIGNVAIVGTLDFGTDVVGAGGVSELEGLTLSNLVAFA